MKTGQPTDAMHFANARAYHPDIPSARFGKTENWTYCTSVKIDTAAHDDEHTVITKGSSLAGASTSRQFAIFVQSDEMVDVETGLNSNQWSKGHSGTYALLADKWYCIAVTGNTSSGCRMVIVGLDGTIYENATFSWSGTEASVFSDYEIGAEETSGSVVKNDMLGSIGFSTYIARELFVPEILELVLNPTSALDYDDCKWFIRCGGNGISGIENQAAGGIWAMDIVDSARVSVGPNEDMERRLVGMPVAAAVAGDQPYNPWSQRGPVLAQ